MIIVTGSSKGLGLSICNRLIANGETVIGLSRSGKSDLFREYNCDVGDYQALSEISKEIKKTKRPVRCLINAAGIASMNLALTTDETSVKNILQTNLLGTIFACQLFSPLMIRKREGLIINFSTIAVPLSLKGESIYAASKAGVEVFSKSFAREMADFDIRVNCIAPGPISTDLLKGISKTQIKRIVDQQIIQKQFKEEDICDLVELLLDEKSKAITGHVFNVGGV